MNKIYHPCNLLCPSSSTHHQSRGKCGRTSYNKIQIYRPHFYSPHLKVQHNISWTFHNHHHFARHSINGSDSTVHGESDSQRYSAETKGSVERKDGQQERLLSTTNWQSAQVNAVKQSRAEVSETKDIAMFTTLRQDQLTSTTMESQADTIINLKAELSKHLTKITELLTEKEKLQEDAKGKEEAAQARDEAFAARDEAAQASLMEACYGYPSPWIKSNVGVIEQEVVECVEQESLQHPLILEQLKRYGISGVLSYGLLNTIYYLTTFLLVWFYFAPAPGKMGYLAAVSRFLQVMAMVWAGSQVTKLIRAAGALALAPLVDRGLSWFTVRYKFESRGKAFFTIFAICISLAVIVFLVVTLLWA